MIAASSRVGFALSEAPIRFLHLRADPDYHLNSQSAHWRSVQANCRRGAREDEVEASHTGGSATERRVHERVADAPVLDDEASQTPFEDVTGLLEHSRRRRIPLEDRGLQTLEAEFGKRVAGSALQRFGRDPLAPEGFADPVADFGGQTMNVVEQSDSDAPDRFSRKLDGEIGWLARFARAMLDPLLRIGARIWMGKKVPEVYPDLAVVCVSYERIDIAARPGSQYYAVSRTHGKALRFLRLMEPHYIILVSKKRHLRGGDMEGEQGLRAKQSEGARRKRRFLREVPDDSQVWPCSRHSLP